MGRIKEWVADLLRSTIKDPNQRIGIAAALGLFSFVEEPTKPWRPEPNLIIPVAVAISALSSPQISQQVENQLSPISSPENQSTLWPLATNLTLDKLREIVNEQYIGKNLSDHFDPSKIVPRLYYPDSPFYSLHLPEVKAGEPLTKFEYPQSPNTIATVFVSPKEKKPTLYFFPSLVIFNTQLTPSINPKGELTYIDPANQLRIIIPQEVLEKIGPDDIGLSEYVHNQLESLINQGKYVLVNHQTSSIRRWEVNKPVGGLGMDLNLRYEENGNLIITVGPQVVEIEKSKIPPFLANLNLESVKITEQRFDDKKNQELVLSDSQGNSFFLILDTNNRPLKIVGPSIERKLAQVAAPSLNVREHPGTGSKKIGSFPKGATLEVTDPNPIKSDGIEWVRVRLPDGTEGYIAWGNQYSQIKEENITPELVIPQSEELIIPAPDFENPKIKQAIDDFVNAMKMGGVKVTEEEVIKKINFTLKKNNAGTSIYAIVNLPLGKNFPQKYVLFKYTGGEWKPASLKDFGVGISDSITTLANLSNTDLVGYNIIAKNAGRVVIADMFIRNPYNNRLSLMREGKITIDNFRSEVKKIREKYLVPLLFQHILWGNKALIDPKLESLSLEERQKLINEYVIAVMQILEPGDQIVVANEVFDSSWPWVNNSDRRYINFLLTGDEGNNRWVIPIIKAAHQANPSVQIILNEFGIEATGSIMYDRSKDQEFYNTVYQLRKNGIPIDVGFQMHINPQFQDLNQLASGLEAQIKKYQGLGCNVVVTELDIRMDGDKFIDLSPEKRNQIQAEYYYRIAKIASKYGVEINLFGHSDRISWLETSNEPRASYTDPTLFEEDGSPKLAYYVFIAGMIEGENEL